ncbi:hypothetical protein COCMIDRAFT_24984 [Bipolaris oryzae ATCC 44560]|uniref:Uncharacterized protein n=1 Tax=Bipolaris oryzae ATCC 44560 TaxID=930090 RepID=W6ZAR8_COCMI|nr:uncharacterized protein COCMIDRAFT_24984 [Bipolaris oryzae ATCC 44560]EUC47065.1 hypothetical protein COCMIDRAFT_24984 [Bipolaris oryzae ATCC 44560]
MPTTVAIDVVQNTHFQLTPPNIGPRAGPKSSAAMYTANTLPLSLPHPVFQIRNTALPLNKTGLRQYTSSKGAKMSGSKLMPTRTRELQGIHLQGLVIYKSPETWGSRGTSMVSVSAWRDNKDEGISAAVHLWARGQFLWGLMVHDMSM